MAYSMVDRPWQVEPMMIYLAISVNLGVVNNIENCGGKLTWKSGPKIVIYHEHLWKAGKLPPRTYPTMR